MARKEAPVVLNPGSVSPLSIRHIESTSEDRKQDAQRFREHKERQQKIKEERFAAIKERRKQGSSGGGNDRGINIEVTSE